MAKRYHLEMPDPVASEIESIREKIRCVVHRRSEGEVLGQNMTTD